MRWEGDDGEFFEREHILGKKTAEARTFVGPATNPIWWGTKGEKRDIYKNPQFEYLYEVWRHFHLFGQWPDGKPYNQCEPDMVDIVTTAEFMYRNNFSAETKTMQKVSEAAAYTHVLAQGKRLAAGG
jgi:hypothetical protein